MEEGGEEEEGGEADEGLLVRFIEYIKNQKVSALEDLASEFGLKTQDVINRVQVCFPPPLHSPITPSPNPPPTHPPLTPLANTPPNAPLHAPTPSR